MTVRDRSTSRQRSPARDSPKAESDSASSSGKSASSVRKHPDVAAVESPPLTSSLHSRNSASSKEETVYLKKLFLLKCVRLTLTFLVIGFGIGVIACEADVLKRYNDTNLDSSWSLPLWPVDINVKPTVIDIVVAALAIALSLLYIFIAFIPSPHSRTTIMNASFTTVSGLGLILSLSAVVYSPVLIHNIFSPFAGATQVQQYRETIQTWTCALYNNMNTFNKDAAILQLPTLSSNTDIVEAPQGFRRMCTESRVGYGLVVGLLALEVLATSIGLIGIGLEKRMANTRKSRYANMGSEKA